MAITITPTGDKRLWLMANGAHILKARALVLDDTAVFPVFYFATPSPVLNVGYPSTEAARLSLLSPDEVLFVQKSLLNALGAGIP